MIRINIKKEAFQEEVPNINEILNDLRPFTKVEGDYDFSKMSISLEFANMSVKSKRLKQEDKFNMTYEERKDYSNSTLKTYMILVYKRFSITMQIENTKTTMEITNEILKVNMKNEYTNRLISKDAHNTIPEIDESIINLVGPSEEDLERMQQMRDMFAMGGNPLMQAKKNIDPKEELNRILDKIATEGIDSLTPKELEFMQNSNN